MSTLTANEIITQNSVRLYYQPGGPKPGNPMYFFGVDWQYAFLDGLEHPYGDISPINMPAPTSTRKWRAVARQKDAPDLPTGSLVVYKKRAVLAKALGDGCAFNLYLPAGCGDLSNPNAFSDFVWVVSNCEVTNVDHGTVTAVDSDEGLTDTYDLTLADEYLVGPIALGEFAAVEVTREVVGIVYGSQAQCGGECGGIDSDGTEWIYALVQDDAASGAVQAYVVYNTSQGLGSWTSLTITGIGVNELVYDIAIVGNRLVVLGTDAYYHALIDSVTGVPGAFTKVTNGFVATKSPRDIYVAGPREVYFAGLGGYIYKATDITSGVTAISAGAVTTNDLLRIAGDKNNQIVAVGNSGTVVRSVNRGRTFALTTVSPVAANLISIAVPSADVYWVGTATGRLFSTKNGGATTWAETIFDGSGSGRVDDIVFATREVGYFAYASATPAATIFATWNGTDWNSGPNRLINAPTFGRANRIAVPEFAASQTAANNLAVAGLSSGGTDGVIYLGVAAQL